jgi:signal transduction histidine kinase
VRKRGYNRGIEEFNKYRSLLAALSDDLSLPLLQIKTTLEMMDANSRHAPAKDSMLLSADAGLQLIEAYRLALRATDHDISQMEPVAIGAVLQDVADQLEPYAKQYATDLIVDFRPCAR